MNRPLQRRLLLLALTLFAAPGGDDIAGQPLSQTYILGADRDSTTGYFLQAGTSAAAPIVSGAVALVAEQFPWMTNKNLATTVLTTGTRAMNPDTTWGRGRSVVSLAMIRQAALPKCSAASPQARTQNWQTP